MDKVVKKSFLGKRTKSAKSRKGDSTHDEPAKKKFKIKKFKRGNNSDPKNKK